MESRCTSSIGVFLFFGSCLPAWGQAPRSLGPEDAIIVTAPAPVRKSDLSSDGAANPASVTVIEFSEHMTRGTRDYAELLKPVMGVAANNFDQGGVGFGFTMRGFTERANGGNVAYTIDGVPVNLSSHPLNNGYGDLTPLIPELLDRLVITRGPFDVRFGSHALGGSAQFITQDRPPSGAAFSTGNFDFARGFGVYSFGEGAVSGYGSLLSSTTSGYRNNAELNQVNTFNKLFFPMPGGTGSVRVQVFSDTFGAPGFLRRDQVENGTLNPKTAINTTDGGSTDLKIVAFTYKQHGEQPLTANVYFMNTDLERFSNRTATIPISQTLAGQNLQTDERVTFGGSLEKYFRWNLAQGMGVDLLLGGGVRRDDVENKLFNTIQRVKGARTEDTDFTLTNPFGYAQANFKPVSWLKLTGGFRYDRLSFSVQDRTRSLNVSPSFGVNQPKAGIVVSPLKGLDLFANYGKGFLPPTAIGGQMSRNPSLGAAELETKEIGVQYKSADGMWHFLADVYRTTFTNEILNQVAPLPPIFLGPSRRDGYDVEGRVRAYKDRGRVLSLFANYSGIDGELIGRTTPGTSIPDVAKFFLKYGFDLTWPLRGVDSAQVITWSAAQVWEGPRPLNATNTLSTKTFSRIDTKLAYTDRNWKGFSVFLTAIIYPDRRLEETAFTFGTPVQVGVSPKAPLTVQGGVYIPF